VILSPHFGFIFTFLGPFTHFLFAFVGPLFFVGPLPGLPYGKSDLGKLQLKLGWTSSYFVRCSCSLPLCKVCRGMTPWPDVVPECEQGPFVQLWKATKKSFCWNWFLNYREFHGFAYDGLILGSSQFTASINNAWFKKLKFKSG